MLCLKQYYNTFYYLLYITIFTIGVSGYAVQRVDVVDNIGSIITTGSEFTENITDPLSNIGYLDGDIWKNTSTNDVFIFSTTTNSWVKLISPTRKRAQYVNGSAAPATKPLIIGPNASIKNSSGKYEYINVEEFDIIIMGNNSGNNYVSLEELSAAYDGKVIRISEKVNQNPKINVVDASNNEVVTFYPGGVNELFDFKYDNTTYNFQLINPFSYTDAGGNPASAVVIGSSNTATNPAVPATNTASVQLKYEFVDFIWQNGEWIPMR